MCVRAWVGGCVYETILTNNVCPQMKLIKLQLLIS